MTSSVTGCSTWSRVFISRNAGSPRSSTQELAGAGAHVADRAREGQGRSPEPCRGGRHRPPATAPPRGPSGGGAGSSSRARRGGRRARAPSNRTWISTWRAPSTSRSRMSRSSPKAAGRLAPGGRERVGEAGRVADGPHALAAAAGRRLDQQRVADPLGRGGQGGVRLVGVVVAGRAPGRRATPRAGGRRPCRPSPGSRPAAARPSAARPRRRASAKSAFSARNPNPGWTASAPAARAAATTASMSSRSSASGPSVAGTIAAMPEPVARPRDARRDLAAIRDEQASGSAVAPPAPEARRGRRRTRQTRQSRHAIGHQRVARAAARSRSSAGRTASTSRAVARPRSGSVPRPSCRDRRISSGGSRSQVSDRAVSSRIAA